jgi:hypothetical protein
VGDAISTHCRFSYTQGSPYCQEGSHFFHYGTEIAALIRPFLDFQVRPLRGAINA